MENNAKFTFLFSLDTLTLLLLDTFIVKRIAEFPARSVYFFPSFLFSFFMCVQISSFFNFW